MTDEVDKDTYVMIQPRQDGKWAVQLGELGDDLENPIHPDAEDATADELFGDLASAVAKAKEIGPSTKLGIQVTDATLAAYAEANEAEEALIRVYKAMQIVGIEREKAQELVSAMLGEGVLFRVKAEVEPQIPVSMVIPPKEELAEQLKDAGFEVEEVPLDSVHVPTQDQLDRGEG